MCGAATQRLELGTGVKNPVARDASVVACAIATLPTSTTDQPISVGYLSG